MKPILDISEWQAGLDYARLAEQISGVIIRCGGTGYGSAHTVYEDCRFEQHYKGFHDQGIPIGVYFFAGAISDVGVDAEIALTGRMLSGKEITLPVYYDVEVPEGSYLDLSVAERTRLAIKYMDGVRSLGYIPGLYTYLYYTSKLDMSQMGHYTIWMAQYNDYLEYNGADLWQYTSDGWLDGYNGRLDLSKVVEPAWWESIVGGEFKPEPEPEKPIDEWEYVDMKIAVLGAGDTGNLVKSLQGILEANGYDLEYCGGCDGIFGAGTEYAVKAYQQERGLDVDGIVGAQTWGSMLEV